MKNFFSFLFILLILSTQADAQVNLEWAETYNGSTNGYDGGSSIATDNEGNVYVGGSTTVDGTNRDYIIIKYNASGVVQWIRNYNGPGNGDDAIGCIDVDNGGNVFVSGFSTGVGTGEDITTIKYDPSGSLQWVKFYNGPANLDEYPVSLEVDDFGDVYVFGNSKSANDQSFVTIKYSASGIEQWQQIYSGPDISIEYPQSMIIDYSGNVCITGYSKIIDDFGIIIGSTYTTVKYNNNGMQKWVKTFGTISDEARDIAADSEGNIYVTGVTGGNSNSFATVKYDSAGAQQWVQIYTGSGNNAREVYAITIDIEDNIYLTGSSTSTANSSDIITIKYNSAGQQQWAKNFNGTGSAWDEGYLLETDEIGNLYVTGSSVGVGTDWDYITIKYQANGDTVWVQRYNGVGNSFDRPVDMTIDASNNVFLTGFSFGGATNYDIATIRYSQSPLPEILKPRPYVKFIGGEKDSITWVDPGWLAVNIICKMNVGTPSESEFVITQGMPNVNSKFLWTIPDTLLSFRSKIIVENANNTTEKIESDIFRIKPYVLTRINSDSTYYEYKKNRDQWGFSNTLNDMWPFTWWNQFDYQGIDTFTNSTYSQWQADSSFSYSRSLDHMDWVSWVNTFSVDACYHSTFLGIYKANAVLNWVSNRNNWNGSCFGIAAANALAFRYKEQFQNKYPNFPAFVNPISLGSDNRVKRIANELYTYQYGNPTQANDKLNHNIVTPIMLLEQLKQMLLEDNARIRTLTIYNNGGSGGHTILAYGLKKDPTIAGLYYVSVYDNSNSASNNPIQISTLAGNGFWGTPDWAGWGGNTGIYLEILAEQYLNQTTFPRGEGLESPFIVPANELRVNSKFGAQIKILDNQGNITGYENGFALSGIPGSLPLISKNGSETPPYGYSLPTDNYSIVLNDFAEDTVETFFFTGNKSFVYERSGATQTQTDRLFFDGGVSAANPDAQTKTVKLLNLINENTQEKLTVLRSLELAQNDSVKIENPDSNKVKIISYGTAKNYDIELNYVTQTGLGRFGDFNIPLTANTSHTFVPVWTDLTNSELQVLVDIGNDGTIDDTLNLINQVTGIGEDQGSLIKPNTFNLAQNYPNPFNPTTKISWQSPINSHQTLKVYDVLGNEVATLVDEFRNAGTYEVSFDAAQLSSGIYFYRLQAGDFVQTKKMILIK